MNFKIIQFAQCFKGLSAFCLCLAAINPAFAQIIAIAPDGSTATYAGPVTASPDGIRAIAPRTTPVTTRATAPVKAAIQSAAARSQLSAELIAAVAWQESHWQQNAVSPKGARGVMQLMPRTARDLGVDAGSLNGNINGGASYLALMMQRFDGDIIKSLAAYDAGPDAVARYDGVPPYRETQDYVNAILGHMAALQEVQP